MAWAEQQLPKTLLAKAVSSSPGGEYAWRLEDIPEVIDAARQLNLVSYGGQLQFRLPDGGTCECYWVEVNTFDEAPPSMGWADRVERSALVGREQFEALAAKFDFIGEGRKAFGPHLEALERSGGTIADTMCFVWYVIDRKEAEANGW